MHNALSSAKYLENSYCKAGRMSYTGRSINDMTVTGPGGESIIMQLS